MHLHAVLQAEDMYSVGDCYLAMDKMSCTLMFTEHVYFPSRFKQVGKLEMLERELTSSRPRENMETMWLPSVEIKLTSR